HRELLPGAGRRLLLTAPGKRHKAHIAPRCSAAPAPDDQDCAEAQRAQGAGPWYGLEKASDFAARIGRGVNVEVGASGGDAGQESGLGGGWRSTVGGDEGGIETGAARQVERAVEHAGHDTRWEARERRNRGRNVRGAAARLGGGGVDVRRRGA